MAAKINYAKKNLNFGQNWPKLTFNTNNVYSRGHSFKNCKEGAKKVYFSLNGFIKSISIWNTNVCNCLPRFKKTLKNLGPIVTLCEPSPFTNPVSWYFEPRVKIRCGKKTPGFKIPWHLSLFHQVKCGTYFIEIEQII